jgi:hypothetical protein
VGGRCVGGSLLKFSEFLSEIGTKVWAYPGDRDLKGQGEGVDSVLEKQQFEWTEEMELALQD